MARQDRDIRRTDELEEPSVYTTDRTVKDYREAKEGRATAETRNVLQDLAWFIPLILLGLLGYYLYQNYYATPAVPKVVPTATTTATPVTTPAVTTTTRP